MPQEKNEDTVMRDFDFHVPTKIIFGRGRVRDIASAIPAEARRIMIVTDRIVAERTPALAAVRRGLEGREVRVFDRVEENPSVATVEAGAREALDFGASFVIGLGGGSPLDAAKGIALLARNSGPLQPYLQGKALGQDPLPLIAVPTTSGTGSEVTPYAVFTDTKEGNKIGYSHPGIFPRLALLDPELTYSMPPAVVLNTGLDVLAHAMEAYLATTASALSDMAALRSIETVLAEIARAVRKEPEAMDRMALAAALAGIAITHGGTILAHIMGYPLTVFHGLAHGRASAVMLVHVLKALRADSTTPARVEAMDAVLQPCGGLETFLLGLGVSVRLAGYGVREEEIPLFARKTILKGDVRITPMAVTVETLEAIYREAL